MFESWILGHFVLILSYVLAIVGIAHMLRHRRSPGSTMAWLLLFVGIPFVGTALYLMFGGRKLRKRQRDAQPQFSSQSAVPTKDAKRFDITIRGYGVPAATRGNRVTLSRNGVDGYRQLTELIEQAQRSIHLVTFIFCHDAVGREILNRLVAKASDGVSVRVLVDGLGSMKTPRSFFKPLLNVGGQLAVFQPVIHIPFRTRTNLRNHRKIVVVDGSRSFSGGMNITAKDIYPELTKDAWQDISLNVDGPAATHLDAIFQEDWKYVTGHRLDSEPTTVSELERGDEVVQVLSSGPDVPNDPMYSASLTGIFRATTRIWIATPYFVPNDALAEALVFACQRGVDVRILIPAKSNHLLSDLAAASLLRDIQTAGGIILRYTPGMLHAKAMIIDDEFAAVGSANFDMRSLFLNYEVMQVCYSQSTIRAVSSWFDELSAECNSELPKPNAIRDLAEGAVRALSPMF